MTAYYNEIDPFAAHILRALIDDGVIAPGDVDERSIVDVQPDDLKGYTQCHFFAGGGLWSVAARMAGWPDDEPIWTGSCPCQPLSVAGQGKGADDERHIWPAFFRLIAERKPAIVFGEQVASALGREWFAGVRLDMEGLGYASGAADLCAAGVGAPHIRQRLYWVGVGDNNAMRKLQPQGLICDKRGRLGNASRGVDMANAERDGTRHLAKTTADEGRRAVDAGAESVRRADGPRLSGGPDARDTSDMADAAGRNARAEREQRSGIDGFQSEGRCDRGPARNAQRAEIDMANAESIGRRGRAHDEDSGRREQSPADPRAGSGDVADSNGFGAVGSGGKKRVVDAGKPQILEKCSNQFWHDDEWITGADGKTRRVKSGVCLLADGVPGRVGQLRIAGNAIVPQVAAAFMITALEAALQ